MPPGNAEADDIDHPPITVFTSLLLLLPRNCRPRPTDTCQVTATESRIGESMPRGAHSAARLMRFQILRQ
jgi:hypothetical protein